MDYLQTEDFKLYEKDYKEKMESDIINFQKGFVFVQILKKDLNLFYMVEYKEHVKEVKLMQCNQPLLKENLLIDFVKNSIPYPNDFLIPDAKLLEFLNDKNKLKSTNLLYRYSDNPHWYYSYFL